jgi:hypothetical protein
MELEFMKQLKTYKMTRPNDVWECSECSRLQGRHDMWFEYDLCEMCHENQTDLLEQYDTLPESVQKIIMEMIHSYDGIKEANEKLKKIGYSFEYGLDAEPYNLRKI